VIGGFLVRPHVAPYLAQAAHLRTQSLLASRILPAEQIIYAEDPPTVAGLRALPHYREADYGNNSNSPYSGRIPASWPRPVEFTFPAIGLDTRSSGKCLFSGALNCWRKDELGNDRLVYVGTSLFPLRDGCRGVCITQRTVTRATWTPGSRGDEHSFMGAGILLREADSLTLYAPQPDPLDPQKITICYSLNNLPGVITCTVRSDGRIHTAITAGPATLITSW
jgi:hypothetical protein